MKWRWLAEKLRLREAVRLMDERNRKAAELEEAAQETKEQSEAVADMSRQAKLDSYGRVRIGKK